MLLLLAAPAPALDVDVHVFPPAGEAAWITFSGVEPGVARTVDVPCAERRTCRVAATVTPEGEQWRVALRVDVVRRRLLGGETVETWVQPTFQVRTEQVAELFSGSEVPAGEGVLLQRGMHVQARVR